MAKRCLYYPFIHFRDEAWLKLSALYWDDVTRIVPRAYKTRDSRDIRSLEDAGIVTRLDPSAYEGKVTSLFSVLLEKHEKALVSRYDIANRSGWSPNLDRFRGPSAAGSRMLAFIHCAKLEPALVERFVELRLALLSRDRKWLGMHPSIVSAYMIALAAEISTRRGLSPISDNASHVSGVTSCTPDDLARSLFTEVDLGKKRRAQGVALTGERVAFVTLRAVLPERLDVVPAKRIVELRARHGGARQAFHDYVDLVRQSLASGDIRDPAAFDEHIRLEYERRLKPELVDLQKGLRSLGLSTFLGSFGVAITLPVGAFLAPLSPAAAIGSAVASLGVAALSHKHREEAGGLVRKSPASFLFVTEQLRPRTFGQRLAESVRRFSLGV